MKILKYIKKSNGNYQVVLDNNKKLDLNENVIVKYNLLYKKEIDEGLLNEIISENNKYGIYNKCIKYIGVRIRSINEIKEYLKKNKIDLELSDKIIDKLIANKLLDDSVFTKAFINDKFNFTTMGPYRIKQELKKHKIDDDIIDKYIYDIDEDKIDEKINKQILKIDKASKNKNNLKNKVYSKLIALGYSSDQILRNINNYDF